VEAGGGGWWTVDGGWWMVGAEIGIVCSGNGDREDEGRADKQAIGTNGMFVSRYPDSNRTQWHWSGREREREVGGKGEGRGGEEEEVCQRERKREREGEGERGREDGDLYHPIVVVMVGGGLQFGGITHGQSYLSISK